MKLVEVLSQIPKLDKTILLSAPKIEATQQDVSDYLNEWGIIKDSGFHQVSLFDEELE